MTSAIVVSVSVLSKMLGPTGMSLWMMYFVSSFNLLFVAMICFFTSVGVRGGMIWALCSVMVTLLPQMRSVRLCWMQRSCIASLRVSAIGFVLERVMPVMLPRRNCV